MTAVYIIVGIILFIMLLLFIPITVNIEFNDDFSAWVKYGFIKIFDSKKKKPEKQPSKHEKEKTPKKKKQQKNNKFSAFFSQKKESLGTMGAVKYFLDIAKDLLTRLIWLVKKIKFKHFKLNLVIATEDAAKTAITYGKVCTAVYPILSLLNGNTNLTLDEVNISADFNKTAIETSVSVILKTKLIYFVIMGVKTLFAYKNLIKEVNDYE